MGREQILAFRLARHGLDAWRSMRLAEAAACPISNYARGSAAVALAARTDGVTREAYERAIDSGELVVGSSLRAAIHALASGDLLSTAPALIADDDEELAEQLGPALGRRLLRGGHIAPGDALREVAEAIEGSLAGGRALTKDELHAELRRRVRGELMPWCRGCGSYHVAPMLWRFAGVKLACAATRGAASASARWDRRRSRPRLLAAFCASTAPLPRRNQRLGRAGHGPRAPALGRDSGGASRGPVG